MASITVQKAPADESNGFLSPNIAGQPDLLFAWLSPYSIDQRPGRQNYPTSPLMRAKHALKRTFTPAKQMNKQQERGKPPRKCATEIRTDSLVHVCDKRVIAS